MPRTKKLIVHEMNVGMSRATAIAPSPGAWIDAGSGTLSSITSSVIATAKIPSVSASMRCLENMSPARPSLAAIARSAGLQPSDQPLPYRRIASGRSLDGSRGDALHVGIEIGILLEYWRHQVNLNGAQGFADDPGVPTEVV